jgi:hypothetical protein
MCATIKPVRNLTHKPDKPQDFQTDLSTQLRSQDEQLDQDASQETTCWADDLKTLDTLLLKVPGYETAWNTLKGLDAGRSGSTIADKIYYFRDKRV